MKKKETKKIKKILIPKKKVIMKKKACKKMDAGEVIQYPQEKQSSR